MRWWRVLPSLALERCADRRRALRSGARRGRGAGGRAPARSAGAGVRRCEPGRPRWHCRRGRGLDGHRCRRGKPAPPDLEDDAGLVRLADSSSAACGRCASALARTARAGCAADARAVALLLEGGFVSRQRTRLRPRPAHAPSTVSMPPSPLTGRSRSACTATAIRATCCWRDAGAHVVRPRPCLQARP